MYNKYISCSIKKINVFPLERYFNQNTFNKNNGTEYTEIKMVEN